VRRGVQVKSNGTFVTVDLLVKRVEEPEPLRGLYQVTFSLKVCRGFEFQERKKESDPTRRSALVTGRHSRIALYEATVTTHH
jgi:hypothetical protein